MPPFQGTQTSNDDDFYVTIDDNRIRRGRGGVFDTAPIPGKLEDQYVVFSQRDVVIGTNPLYDAFLDSEKDAGRQSNKNDGDRVVFDFLERYFSCMCVGAQPQNAVRHSRHKVATATRKNIVYPIAKYPDRLNSPKLVEKRRKSLEKHLTFQPVRSDYE